MSAKLARLTHKIAVQLHLLAESCSIHSSRSRLPVRKLLDTPSYDFCYLVHGLFNDSVLTPEIVQGRMLWVSYHKRQIKKTQKEAIVKYLNDHSIQTGCGAHPAPYPMGTRGSFPEGKAAGVWSSPFTST